MGRRLNGLKIKEMTITIISIINFIFLASIMVSSLLINPLVSKQLIEGDLLSNGRYAIVFEAHEAINEFKGKKITVIGSSIIRDAIDRKCLEVFLLKKRWSI